MTSSGSAFLCRPRAAVWLVAGLAAASPAFGQVAGEDYIVFGDYRLGATTLADIRRDLGRTPLVESGDAGDFIASICYRTPRGAVRFLSSELGGSDHVLLGFDLVKSTSGSMRAKQSVCYPWPRQKPAPTLGIGDLRLGMTRADFSRVLHGTVRWENQVAFAEMASRRKMTNAELERLSEKNRRAILTGMQQDYFEVLITVIGTFRGKELIELRIWKAETL